MTAPRRRTPVSHGKRRLSYAHVASGLALFLSLSSAAFAAHRYLLTSTKQIKPSVLSALRARHGAAGVGGAAGLQGARGPAGDQGPPGLPAPAPTVLAPAQTETGVWGASTVAENGANLYRLTGSFATALANPIPEGLVGYVARGSLPSRECPGVGQAAPGFLCLYEAVGENVKTPSQVSVFDPDDREGHAQSAGRSGFGMVVSSAGEGDSSISGTFAVTAPREGERIEFVARHQEPPR